MFYEQLKREQECIAKQITSIEDKLVGMPEGKLICAKNREWYKWYVSDGKKKIYISSKNNAIAEKLAEKCYLLVELEELKNKKSILEKLETGYLKYSKETEQFWEKHPGIRQLLKLSKPNLSEELQEWANAEYKRNTGFPENLKFGTPWGEVFRSKSESMIAKSLRERGIPYRYECALKLGDETVYPDFTIRHPRTGRIYYYEHFGKMDDVGYTNRNLPKILSYTKHGIIPGIHLIMSFETQAEPLSMYTIESILSQYFE
ncbi:MAG: hypothetical protein E7290_06580 [Lachnospiraceae bacterium]|nr:hypothetical protein [Lachnospiraceae bacterium]